MKSTNAASAIALSRALTNATAANPSVRYALLSGDRGLVVGDGNGSSPLGNGVGSALGLGVTVTVGVGITTAVGSGVTVAVGPGVTVGGVAGTSFVSAYIATIPAAIPATATTVTKNFILSSSIYLIYEAFYKSFCYSLDLSFSSSVPGGRR
ncbi:MAG TPA: hypothetical protein VLO13_02945 [Halomonas sp.]|nr:hypothetical protein [Halomonas sp.]